MSPTIHHDRPPLVDCDVHPMLPRAEAVFPYLSASWRRHFEAHGTRLYARARDRYNHPNRTHRLDAVPSDGGPAGSDRELTVRSHVTPYGISAAVLLPQEPYGITTWSDAAAAAAFTSATNAYFEDEWVAYDPRFTLAVTVTSHDPAAAAAEIRRRGRDAGVVAVQLLLAEQMLGSRWFDPIYEAATELGLPIIYHQSGNEGCYTTSQGPAGGIPRSYGERHVVLTQVGAANLVDLVVGGAFERFPGLRIVMVEWGFSWLTSLLARMDHLWTTDPAAAPLVRRLPSAYVSEHVTFTTQPLDETDTVQELEALFALPGIDSMLLFSSDYPHYDTDDPDFVLKRIPRSMRDRVCYENAVATFGERILAARG
ncbi:amidohydrolase family protein [Pseudonocardia xishanensis]|uniref:Amidohydrolase family protein n=1 Tax=Pseudonocardia xishanensis TaxID=630995 RepID=A0ABP8RT90_9PSEU